VKEWGKHALKKLALGSGRVANNADVYVPTQFNSVFCHLADAAQHLKDEDQKTKTEMSFNTKERRQPRRRQERHRASALELQATCRAMPRLISSLPWTVGQML
jgi:hypothetical protein